MKEIDDMRWIMFRLPTALVMTVLVLTLSPCRAGERLEYNRDVRPILAENCFACHGPDKAARKADLRLDIRDEAVRSGAIVPGNADDSGLVERIFSDARARQMPPAKSHKKLTAAQKAALKAWVAQGAEYQDHWAFIPPRRPAIPAVKDPGWARNPVDLFILAALQKRGLTPAPQADRRTLARRLSLDLLGLPPEPADVEAFVNDRRPDAYERYVDRLLSSPHWGEHRGRYWLDAARYADTHGIHFDNFREVWSYRDWVIDALNENTPFDRFTIEQIAGDLLPGRTLEQQIASGFNRCHITTNEGGAIDEEYLVLYTRDRTETVAQVWLGLTAGCAVCHDHKLDPLSQREFYRMAAFFNNTTQRAMDGNIKDTPPIVPVPRRQDRPRWDELQRLIASARGELDRHKASVRPEFEKWLGAAKPDVVTERIPADKLHLHAPFTEGKGNRLTVQLAGRARPVTLKAASWAPNGHIAQQAYRSRPGAVTLADAGDFDHGQAFSFGTWVRLQRPVGAGAIAARMDEDNGHRGWDLWVEGNRVGTHIIHRWPDDALKVITQGQLQPGRWHHVFVSYDGKGKAGGVQIYIDGVLQQARQVQADSLKGTPRTTVPLKFGQRHKGAAINDVSLQDFRIYGRAVTAHEVQQIARGTRAAWLLSKGGTKGAPAERDELFDWWLAGEDRAYRAGLARLDGLFRDDAAIRARGTVAHVMQEKSTRPTAHILFRGEYDKRRDEVGPDTPHILPALPGKLPRNRLGFAQWLVQPGQPLTARVTVNRFWQELFGQGIVRTSGDFGVAGELPSHPELLDWLALEFQEKGWDIKQFFRLLVTSATYRQAAQTTPIKRERDPFNVLLSRGPRFRMDGEMVRDYALAASGLLISRLGGPSVRPYQPEGVWEAVAMIGSNTRNYQPDRGEGLYRRSLYTFWKRSAPPASLDIFNAPNRETCTVRRERTNTPLQALVTLNDPQFVEACRTLAQQAITQGKTAEARIDHIARRLLSRPLRPDESGVVKGVLDDLLAEYRGKPAEARKLTQVGEALTDPTADPTELAGYTMLVNTLMNLDEVLNK